MSEHLTPLSTAYVSRETSDRISAICTERQSAVEQAAAPRMAQVSSLPKAAYQTSAVFLGAGYHVLRVAEQSLFAVTPLPLQQLKNGLQQVGIPLGVTAVAAQVPGVDQLVNGAVHFGSDLLGNGASAAATNGLNAIGQQIQSGLPNGLGIHSVSGALGNAVSPVVTNLAQKSGQLLGGTVTAAGIGKFVLNGAQAVFSQVREKGPMRTIEDAIVGAQSVIAKTQAFLQSAQSKITNLFQGERTMSPSIAEQFNDPAQRDQLQGNAVGVGETADSLYARRVDSSITDVTMTQQTNPTYQVVQGEYLLPSEDFRLNPMNADTFLALYNATGDLKPGDVMGQELKVVSPAKVSMDSDGNYSLVEKGQVATAELYQEQAAQASRSNPVSMPEPVLSSEPEVFTSLETELIPEQTPAPEPTRMRTYQDLTSEELQELSFDTNGSGPEPKDDGIQYTTPVAEAAEESSVTPEPEAASPATPVAEAKGTAPAPIQRENEDFALSLQNMLSQRGVDTQRFQVDVNGQTAFKMENAVVTQNNLDAKAVEAIKTALNDPANLQGEVKISQGGKVLLHVKDGQVINDPLGLTKPAVKAEVNSPSQMLYSEASKDVQGAGLQRTQAIAANAFESGATKPQVMDMIKSHDPEFTNQVKECGTEQAAMIAIGAAVQAAQTQAAVAQQPQPAQTQAKEPAMQR